MSDAPTVSVIVVNYNTRDDAVACVESVIACGAKRRIELIVIDNGSSDGSADALRQRFRVQEPGAPSEGDSDVELLLIESPHNQGFARANNRAFEYARGQRLVLLNPDARLNLAALDTMEAFLRGTSDAAGCGVQLVFPDGRRQNSYDNAPTLLTEIIPKGLLRRLFPSHFPSKRVVHREPLEVDLVIGACLMLDRAAVEAVGRFDPGYFLFMEEADLCLRLRKAGRRFYYLPGVTLVHGQGKSKAQSPAAATIEYHRSNFRYFQRHFGLPSAYLVRASRFLKLLVDLPLSLIGMLATLGLDARLRRKAKVQAALIAWHLLGCPRRWGMEGKRE